MTSKNGQGLAAECWNFINHISRLFWELSILKLTTNARQHYPKTPEYDLALFTATSNTNTNQKREPGLARLSREWRD
jgi:hypothetical protein